MHECAYLCTKKEKSYVQDSGMWPGKKKDYIMKK